MNEFIVWDIKSKCFVLDDNGFDRFEMYMDGTLHYYQDCYDGDGFSSEDYKSFNYIGKTDINDKKIYADCSIVEFIINWEVKKGYFVYCNKKLKYLFYDVVAKMYKDYDYLEIKDFKIIDTIQENKLGLIK